MKGTPLLRIAIILMLLAVVFWPVLKITRHHKIALQPTASPTPNQQQAQTITPTLPVTLLLHTAPSPIHCSVSQHGVVLLNESNAISPGEYRAAVEITKGEDLLITAEWKDEEPHALRAEVLVHGYQAHLEKNFWAQRSLEDTLSVPESFLP